MVSIKKLSPLLLVILLSLFALTPFFQPGFFSMHDNTQVERVSEITNSIKDGMFPVRWVLNLGFGYGYPIFNFYGPFPYYYASFFAFFFNVLIATKIMIASAIMLSGIFMYLLAKEFWGKKGAILSALLFVFAPYHAVNTYVRGAIGELWAYAFLPLVFYGIWKSYKEKKWKYVVIGSLGFAGLTASHNLSAFMITPFILALIMFLFFYSDQKQKIYIGLVFLLGLLISGFYWLPAILEMGYTNVRSQVGGGADFRDHYVCISQLWNSPWGFGGSAKGCLDGLSLKIGKIHVAFAILSLITALILYLKTKKINKQIIAIVIGFVGLFFSIFLTLKESSFIWEIFKPMEYIQYPWRFLTLISFFISFIAGFILFFVNKVKKIKLIENSLLFLFLFVILLFNTKLFAPQFSEIKAVGFYTNTEHISWETSKISSEYMPVDFIKPSSKDKIQKSKITIIRGSGTFNIKENKANKLTVGFNSNQDTLVHANIAFFPAWKLYVDGALKEYQKTNSGLEFKLKEGKHLVEFKFEQTLIEKIGNILSFSGLIILILGIIYSYKRNEKAS
ncbi:hypothetical protein KKG52_02725 [Patescibacteria group bacterium]|nr:hypothetical protein [Patescibacteria group bacterium]